MGSSKCLVGACYFCLQRGGDGEDLVRTATPWRDLVRNESLSLSPYFSSCLTGSEAHIRLTELGHSSKGLNR